MDALIMSCGTGGGHNAAGTAIAEELRLRGHHAVMINPYSLCDNKSEHIIDNIYISIVKTFPKAFGLIYGLGNLYRKLPFRSPVYHLNRLMLKNMQAYLKENPADIIIMPHLFPAEIITAMKNAGIYPGISLFIATDYTCIPFTEETDCDYYIIPSSDLKNEYTKRGIPKEKLMPFGIPCRFDFTASYSKSDAKKSLGLDESKKYILISGGSMGAGKVGLAIKILHDRFRNDKSICFIVICGSNKKLYSFINKHYNDNVIPLEFTGDIAKYMKASDIFISKPGGLSSTEALVSGTPLIHISPIPGCETYNMNYFSKKGYCIPVKKIYKELIPAINMLLNNNTDSDADKYNVNATKDICDFCESLTDSKKYN